MSILEISVRNAWFIEWTDEGSGQQLLGKNGWWVAWFWGGVLRRVYSSWSASWIRIWCMFSGNKPAPRHPEMMFFFVIPCSLASMKRSNHSTFWILPIPLRRRREIWVEIACFKGAKTPTSSGCNRWEERGGRRMRAIWLWMQNW